MGLFGKGAPLGHGEKEKQFMTNHGLEDLDPEMKDYIMEKIAYVENFKNTSAPVLGDPALKPVFNEINLATMQNWVLIKQNDEIIKLLKQLNGVSDDEKDEADH